MLNRPRVIPILGIIDYDLVKTIEFKKPRYLGDPINAVKIFNGKNVDELVILDIRATIDKKPINFDLLAHIAQQAFMPLGYGGGIQSIDDVKRLFRMGYEKVIFNTAFIDNLSLLKSSVDIAGSQSVVVSLDFKKSSNGIYHLYTASGTRKHNISLDDIIERVVESRVGEVVINVIDRDGSMTGYDLELIKSISSRLSIPVIANSGAGAISDFKKALVAGAHSVAATSMFVYYGTQKAVLITFPKESDFQKMGIYG